MTKVKTKDEIMAVYVNEFKPRHEGLELNGHLFKGRVYLCLKSEEEGGKKRTLYRIYFNETKGGLDGIFIKSLNESNESWKCDLEELDFKNIEKYSLHDSDLNYAIDIKNMTLEEVLDKMDGDLPESEKGKTVFQRLDEEIGEMGGFDEEKMIQDAEDAEKSLVEYLEENLNNVEHKRKPREYNKKNMELTMNALDHYIGTTFDDKYQDNVINFNGMFSSDQGKGINIFNAVKYLSRYNTEGFEKSNNPKDLLKAAHYILIELNRVS